MNEDVTKMLWDDRTRTILSMLYGCGQPAMTQTDIAEHFGITPGRVRQIERRAIRKLLGAIWPRKPANAMERFMQEQP